MMKARPRAARDTGGVGFEDVAARFRLDLPIVMPPIEYQPGTYAAVRAIASRPASASQGHRSCSRRSSSPVNGKKRTRSDAKAAGRHDAGRPHISVVESPL